MIAIFHTFYFIIIIIYDYYEQQIIFLDMLQHPTYNAVDEYEI